MKLSDSLETGILLFYLLAQLSNRRNMWHVNGYVMLYNPIDCAYVQVSAFAKVYRN